MNVREARQVLMEHVAMLKELGFVCVEPPASSSVPPVAPAVAPAVTSGSGKVGEAPAIAAPVERPVSGERIAPPAEAPQAVGAVAAVAAVSPVVRTGLSAHPFPMGLFSSPSVRSLQVVKPPAVSGLGAGAGPAAVLAGGEPGLSYEERVAGLSDIAREVAACRNCRLCEHRKRVVPGQGNPMSRLVFVGEGPGADEDAQGLAFVGRAGQLLTDILGAMGLERDEVFIANVVKCRPPENRAPLPDEMGACEPFLRRQLEILRPAVLVALGGVALKCLIGNPNVSITKVRGVWTSYAGIPLMPTFHPAYLLRNPAGKRPVWEDMQRVMEVFGLKPRGKRE